MNFKDYLKEDKEETFKQIGVVQKKLKIKKDTLAVMKDERKARGETQIPDTEKSLKLSIMDLEDQLKELRVKFQDEA